MESYVPVFLVIALAVFLGWLLANLSRWMGPLRPNLKKSITYESGMDPVGTARERFSVKFYLIAMLFILFDIEVIFMYPWSVQFKELVIAYGWFPVWEISVFIGILFAGYIYVFKRKGLDWS